MPPPAAHWPFEDGEVDGYKFTLMLNCRTPVTTAAATTAASPFAAPPVCVPVAVASVTPHRVYNRADGGGGGGAAASPQGGGAGASSGGGHWHVELELQTLLVPVEHQGKGIGTVMQRAM